MRTYALFTPCMYTYIYIWVWVKTFWYWTGTRGYPVQYPVQYPIEQKGPHRSIPPVQYPVQYPCSIPLFNKYPASILGTFWGSSFNTPFNTRSIPVQYPFNTSLWAFQLRCPAMPPKSVGCLFRKCPPFNTPRYPPVQYLPFNTPVQYPIEQKAAAYPPGTGGFDSQPY